MIPTFAYNYTYVLFYKDGSFYGATDGLEIAMDIAKEFDLIVKEVLDLSENF